MLIKCLAGFLSLHRSCCPFRLLSINLCFRTVITLPTHSSMIKVQLIAITSQPTNRYRKNLNSLLIANTFSLTLTHTTLNCTRGQTRHHRLQCCIFRILQAELIFKKRTGSPYSLFIRTLEADPAVSGLYFTDCADLLH